MPSTVFSPGTVIAATWLNDINKGVLQPSLKTLIGGLTIPDFTIDHSTTNGRIFYGNTNPLDWATGPGKMTVAFELVPTGYFAANPNGHIAIILRQDPALINTLVRGQGVACGNFTASLQTSDLNPTTLLETWFNGIGSGNYLWSNSEAARSHLGLQDGTRYKFIVESTKTVDDNRYLRYRLWSYQATNGNWQLESDSGDVLDHNTGADLTQSGLFFAQAFEGNLSTWSLPFTNIKVTWGPADLAVPDQTIKLSRYGAQLEGDLNFIGNARRIKAPYVSGTSLVNYLTVQSSTTNTATSFVVKPNGTGTIANTLYSNNSTSSTVWQGVSVGMTSTEALIESLSLGASTLPIGINVGASNRLLTLDTNGMTFVGNSRSILFPTFAGPSLANWFGFQSSSANSATSVVVKPNGTATTANTLYSNNATSTTVYQAVTVGMTSTEGLIESVSLGATTLPVGINVGAGTRIATFKTTGINLLGATTDIGVLIGWSSGLTTWGGSNANTFSTTATVGVDAICVPGAIATALTATYSASNIETYMRPLWCMLSYLVKNLQDKKVI